MIDINDSKSLTKASRDKIEAQKKLHSVLFMEELESLIKSEAPEWEIAIDNEIKRRAEEGCSDASVHEFYDMHPAKIEDIFDRHKPMGIKRSEVMGIVRGLEVKHIISKYMDAGYRALREAQFVKFEWTTGEDD